MGRINKIDSLRIKFQRLILPVFDLIELRIKHLLAADKRWKCMIVTLRQKYLTAKDKIGRMVNPRDLSLKIGFYHKHRLYPAHPAYPCK